MDQNRVRLEIESLEERLVPFAARAFAHVALMAAAPPPHAATAVQQGPLLAVQGLRQRPNVITLDTVGTQTRLTLNGRQTFYRGVTQLVISGGDRADDISNNTPLPWTVIGGGGDDTILGGAGNDTYVPGEGRDVVYDLLGTNTIVAADGARDRVFTNFASTVLSDPADDVVRFFAPSRTPGSGTLSLEKGVLYVTPTNAGTQVSINESGRNLVVTYDFGKGPQTFVTPKAGVRYVAYFGGSGNDIYVNNSRVSDVAYGSAGNDVVVGGRGRFSLLKGSGGNDVVQGRARRNDLSGNAGADILIGGARRNTFRTDALDAVFSQNPRDLFVPS